MQTPPISESALGSAMVSFDMVAFLTRCLACVQCAGLSLYSDTAYAYTLLGLNHAGMIMYYFW